jgi:hypothetical protein
MPRVAARLLGAVTLPPLVLIVSLATRAQAQTIEDHLMMPKGDLCTGFLYMHDSWDEYWEGTLKRDNENIGTLTTQSVAWMGTHGVTDRLNVIGMVPYVWTSPGQGVLSGMSGFQDLTLAAKYRVMQTDFTGAGTLRAFAVGSLGGPLGDYTPDFMPLSIGSAANWASARLTLSFQTKRGFFLNATGAHTWRGNVTLDRPAYFTDGQLYLSDQVDLPNVFDFAVSAGYQSGTLHFPISFSMRDTRGGGDIRRQDMPFVSNRMDFSKVDALVMYQLPRRRDLALRLGATYTVDGRNVGQATTLLAGLLYTFHF